MEDFAAIFVSEPLTPQQDARLPQAEAIVDKAFPAGTYRKMMDETLAPMMDQISASVNTIPIGQIAAIAGLEPEQVDTLGEATLGEVMEIIDPAYEARTRLINASVIKLVADLADEIEPSFRAGLARAYAVRFERGELNDIAQFFATPSGEKYAAQSFLIFTDPQVMSVMGEMMPLMMKRMPELMAGMRAEMESLPEPRNIEDLSPAERERLAELLGVSATDLEPVDEGGDEV